MGLAAVPYIMMAVSAASTFSKGVSARKEAKNKERQQATNNLIIRQAAARSYGDVAKAEGDIYAEEHRESLKNQAAFIRAKGHVLNMAGASGTRGGAVDSMIRDLNQTRGANLNTIASNTGTQLDKIRKQTEDVRYTAQRQQGTKTFSKPSGFSIIAGTVGAGMKGYSAGSSFATVMGE